MGSSSLPIYASDLDQLLGAGISSLDLSASERAMVIRRYHHVGDTLDAHWQTTTGENQVYAQGSFLLGTVTRKIHDDDDVDIDLVALRGLDKSSTSQLALKIDTGHGLSKIVREPESRFPVLEESDRCWTLDWPQMHLDVLPGIPNPDGSDTGVLITDMNVTQWQPTDPLAYARWFHDSAIADRAERDRQIVASGVEITEVPDWQRKTNLQLVVQVLKRHRDIYFTGRLHLRPSSIVITTIAALAYKSGDDLYGSLRTVAADMADHVQYVDGRYLVENPVLPEENFADYWDSEPWRPRELGRWIEALKSDIESIPAVRGNQHVLDRIGHVLGPKARLAGAQALGRPLVEARRSGNLRASASTAMLSTTGAAASPVVPNHDFYGGLG
jgi:hypothetical protein